MHRKASSESAGGLPETLTWSRTGKPASSHRGLSLRFQLNFPSLRMIISELFTRALVLVTMSSISLDGAKKNHLIENRVVDPTVEDHKTNP